MPILTAWAQRHGISHAALQDLYQTMRLIAPDTTTVPTGQSETSIQQRVRLAAAQRGMRLWRNNSGAAFDERGIPVRFGLGNDSAEVNKVMKSSDLIGITPIRCGCGLVYGVFTALECKRSGWTYKQSDDRAVAQLNFINIVNTNGGIGKFITGSEQL